MAFEDGKGVSKPVCDSKADARASKREGPSKSFN